MNYTSTKRIQSESCAGASFVIKKMTVRRRAALQEKQRPFLDQLRDLHEERALLAEAYDEALAVARKADPPIKAAFPAAKLKRLVELTRQVQDVDVMQMTPEAVRFCLIAISGLMIEDPKHLGADPPAMVDATLDLVLEHGPDEFYEEIAGAVAQELGLLAEEKQNLPSASTLAVVGAGNDGNAAPAGTLDSTTIEAAGSSTAPESATVSATP